MISELKIENDVEGGGRGLVLRHYLGICRERLRITTKNSVRMAGYGADI
jgi:hypothetical protein